MKKSVQNNTDLNIARRTTENWKENLRAMKALKKAGAEVNGAQVQWQTARKRLTLSIRQVTSLQSAVCSAELLMRHSSKTIWKCSLPVRPFCKRNSPSLPTVSPRYR